MNDENLEIYLYNQFNQVLDSNEDATEKQTQLGNLFINASGPAACCLLHPHRVWPLLPACRLVPRPLLTPGALV